MDNLGESNRSAAKVNGHDLPRVSPEESGEGLPYAPENWPRPGDIWKWKVGRRIVGAGYFADRYLYLPDRLRHSESAINFTCKRYSFASKLSVGKYIKEVYPDTNVEEFFASFSWRILAKKVPLSIDNLSDSLPKEIVKGAAADTSSGVPGCKAGNKMCSSIDQEGPIPVATTPCDHCCINPKFCRYCCCVLCKKSVSSEYEGYTYVKCEAKDDNGYICGHLGHIECALQCFWAGKVGGNFDLDAEYLCRRCVAKTDLLPYAAKLFDACKSISVRDDIEKILKLALSIVRGSQKENAKVLHNDIELAIKKVNVGTTLKDIWREKNDSPSLPAGVRRHKTASVIQSNEDSSNISSNLGNLSSASSELKEKYENSETEVDEVLCALRNGRKPEFNIAEEKMKAKKHRTAEGSHK